MGIFDNFLDKMKLTSEDDELDEEYTDDEDDDDVEEAPPKKKLFGSKHSDEPEYEEEKKPEPAAKPRPVARTAPQASNRVVRYKNSGMEVCVFKPNNIEDGREISDTLLAGKAVVLNLEGIDVNLAQRIIDFTSGACYSIRGNLQKISNYIFIVTPESVDISGDFQELISSNDLGFRTGNMY